VSQSYNDTNIQCCGSETFFRIRIRPAVGFGSGSVSSPKIMINFKLPFLLKLQSFCGYLYEYTYVIELHNFQLQCTVYYKVLYVQYKEVVIYSAPSCLFDPQLGLVKSGWWGGGRGDGFLDPNSQHI
jgi:hypothetical protein